VTIGRNEPCPCGSGNKYKKCCRERDEEQSRARLRAAHEKERLVELQMRELAARRAAAAALPAHELEHVLEHAHKVVLRFDDADDLDELTNSVLDLIKERRFDEALVACDRLLREYPEVHDGFERSALVHDALGNHALAADFWRKAVDFVEHPDNRDGYDEELIDDFRDHLAAAAARATASADARAVAPAEAEPTPSADQDHAR